MKNKGKILALDFGEKSVGLAITDENQSMAFGKGKITNFGSLKKLFEKIHTLCKQEKIAAIVMGIPLSLEDPVSKQAQRIKNIGFKLQYFLQEIPLFFIDESFSSYEAQKILHSMNIQIKKHKQKEDELAAILILQKYLDQNGI